MKTSTRPIHQMLLAGLAGLLALLVAALPAGAGQFEQFDDVGDLTRHLLSGGVQVDGIPAMTNPRFQAASRATYLTDFDLVIGVVRNGEVKAYPENLGWRHEIINDEIGGEFISVTLCPLTGTPQVFAATDTDGSQIEFGVSGLLLNSNLVMYDRRDNTTLWPQMIYTAINGSAKGQQLELLPAIVTTFEMWKKMYPDSQVPVSGSGLDRYPTWQSDRYASPQAYAIYPYSDYRTNHRYFIAPPTTGDPDLTVYASKEMVTGICLNDELRAYPFSDMFPSAVINDELGGEPLLVVFHWDSQTAMPFSRVVDGRPLTFYQVEATGQLPVEFRDVETRTTWDLLGRGVAGPLEGRQLEQLPAYNSMWFAWDTYWPQTTVWQAGQGIIDEPLITAVLEPQDATVPDDFDLQQNAPNPFNPSTRIRFALPVDGQATLTVYNVGGQRVRSLADGAHPAGDYVVDWDGTDDAGRPLASGVYHYRLDMPGAGYSQTRRMTLTR